MIATVSRRARERRGGFSVKNRLTQGAQSAEERSWKPAAVSIRRMPRGPDSKELASAASASPIAARVHEESTRCSRPSGIGSAAAKSSASRTASRGGELSPGPASSPPELPGPPPAGEPSAPRAPVSSASAPRAGRTPPSSPSAPVSGAGRTPPSSLSAPRSAGHSLSHGAGAAGASLASSARLSSSWLPVVKRSPPPRRPAARPARRRRAPGGARSCRRPRSARPRRRRS